MEAFRGIRQGIIERYSILADNLTEFAKSIHSPLKQSFRINTLKGDKEVILEQLRNYDYVIAEVPWNDKAYVSNLNNLGSSLEHFVGQTKPSGYRIPWN